jgi:hypothetical protein
MQANELIDNDGVHRGKDDRSIGNLVGKIHHRLVQSLHARPQDMHHPWLRLVEHGCMQNFPTCRLFSPVQYARPHRRTRLPGTCVCHAWDQHKSWDWPLRSWERPVHSFSGTPAQFMGTLTGRAIIYRLVRYGLMAPRSDHLKSWILHGRANPLRTASTLHVTSRGFALEGATQLEGASRWRELRAGGSHNASGNGT